MKLRNRLAVASFAATMAGVYADPVRRVMMRWGATDDEIRATLPGDTSIACPRYVTDKAITIAATPAEVFPWLTQLGIGRGGFYSYDRLENLMGLGVHTVDVILPPDRHLAIGDILPNSARQTDQGVWVETLEPDHAIVLRGTLMPGVPMGPTTTLDVAAPWWGDWTWAFVVEPTGSASSRLHIRLRMDYRGPWMTIVRYLGLEPSQFVMERKMLMGIRDRAERAGARADTPILLEAAQMAAAAEAREAELVEA